MSVVADPPCTTAAVAVAAASMAAAATGLGSELQASVSGVEKEDEEDVLMEVRAARAEAACSADLTWEHRSSDKQSGRVFTEWCHCRNILQSTQPLDESRQRSPSIENSLTSWLAAG